jgi:hypothetical protein
LLVLRRAAKVMMHTTAAYGKYTGGFHAMLC